MTAKRAVTAKRAIRQEEKTVRLRTADGERISVSYTLIRSDRRSISLVVDRNGQLSVRAPRRALQRDIEELLQERADWIVRHMAEQRQRAAGREAKRAELTDGERKALREECIARLRPMLEERIRYYEPLLPAGHRPLTRIAVRDQKTRWGSCSSKGTLSFNWRLALVPVDCLDYVVVHELCHLVWMNHSPAFWALVESILPDWKARRQSLREWEYTLDI